MSTDEPTAAVEPETEHAAHKKSPSFHLLPNSETFHRVKDPLTLHGEHADKEANDEKTVDETPAESGHTEKSPSFHRLPNSETFHVVKDPLKLK